LVRDGALPMRREKALKRGRWFWIFVAGLVGFLIGDRHATTWQPKNVSASESVALRFPEAKTDAAVSDTAAEIPYETTSSATNTRVVGGAQLALLSPEPMVPPPVQRPTQQAPIPATIPQAAVASPPAKAAPVPHPRAEPKVAASAADDASRHINRPGLLLNDAQIASIKRRLHLTPDQESMWPAVEAALRNVAYAQTRSAHRHDAPPSAAQLASADPDSVEVQGLKSAAIPLLMSFSDEQKNEVRSLAHVMGLDKLASEL
jgi:hypothetical protein